MWIPAVWIVAEAAAICSCAVQVTLSPPPICNTTDYATFRGDGFPLANSKSGIMPRSNGPPSPFAAYRMRDPCTRGRGCLSIQFVFESGNRRNDFFKLRRCADDHSSHSGVVAAQLHEHCFGRRQREGSRSRAIEAEVRTVEEHAGMSHAVRGKCTVCDSASAEFPIGRCGGRRSSGGIRAVPGRATPRAFQTSSSHRARL